MSKPGPKVQDVHVIEVLKKKYITVYTSIRVLNNGKVVLFRGDVYLRLDLCSPATPKGEGFAQ